MIGIGIDASTSIIGYSVFQDDKLLYCDKLEPIDGNWRERVHDFIPQIQNIIDKYKVDKIIMEDVPLMSRQSKILVQLGVCQGALLTIAQLNNIEIEFVGVGTWRKNIGISTGERDRNSMKIKSIVLTSLTFLPYWSTKVVTFLKPSSNLPVSGFVTFILVIISRSLVKFFICCSAFLVFNTVSTIMPKDD